MLDDPLDLCARLAWEIAPSRCRVDPARGESCAWHHGLWPILRLLRLNTSPARSSAFYGEALGMLGPSPQLLISGSADYAMFAVALAALRSRAVEPRIGMVDLCETPLVLTRWYAEREKSAVSTWQADILDFASVESFDTLCTDSFLGQFPAEERGGLIARWRSLLRPGGLAITVNRLRPDADPAMRIVFSEEQARELVATVSKGAATLPFRVAPDELAPRAAAYAARQGAWPVRSAEEIRGLFESNGFQIERLTVARAAGTPCGSAPTLWSGAPYAHVVARRT